MNLLCLPSAMIRSAALQRLTTQVLACTRRPCLLQGPKPLRCRSFGHKSAQQSVHGSLIPRITGLIRYSDLSTQKYTRIYTLPHITLLRAVSRLKLLQTAFTLAILPPVYVCYFMGSAPLSLVSYSTGIALFAGVMLYTASHFFRKAVGMMYLDASDTTLKVSHLTFWGKRQDVYLPVSDVMTIADTGDSINETILKLKTYSSSQTWYFSPYFGRVVDKDRFEKVFGRLK